MAGANVLYPSGSQNMLSGNIRIAAPQGGAASASYVSLLTNGYSYVGNEEFYDTIDGNVAAGATPQQLTNITCLTGTLEADDVTFSSVDTGQTIQHVVIYQDGVASTNDYLIAHYGNDAAGNPINITTNGGSITITWNATGIFALSGNCA